MSISYKVLKPVMIVLLLLTAAVYGSIPYDTDFYHNFKFHPISQHEPQTPASKAH